MNRLAAAIACLLAVTLIAFAPPACAAGTRVTGTVIDAETQQPIAGADVELQNTGGGPGYHRTRTDAKGAFAIDGVSTNRYYTFSVDADGYTDWVLEGWQFPGAQREVAIVVPLDRAGRLQVRVSGADGKPVAGARVTVHPERSAGVFEGDRREPDVRFTAKDGAVAFEGLRAGTWMLGAEAPGLRMDELRGIAVRRGETTTLPVTMTRPASLLGSVRLADSTGVAGVNVVARGPAEATATTDAGGFFSFGDLAPGRWRIEVAHDGLEPGVSRDGVVLREGDSRELSALRVTPKPASLAFVLQREVFAPADKQQVGVRAFRVGAIELTLWRLPEARLLDAEHDFRARYGLGADTTGLERVDHWTRQLSGGAPFAWREETVALPQEVPAGVYVLEGRAGALRKRALFFVSDLGLVVKRSPKQLVVWAGSLKTGVPLAGVTVLGAAGTRPGEGIGAGKGWEAAIAAARGRGAVTNDDGLATLPPAPGGGHARIVAVAPGHGVAVAEPPLAGAAGTGGDQVYLFTERPIYRPGQTVDWKLFARRGGEAGYTVPPAAAVTLALRGPDDASVDVTPAQLGPGGSADGHVDLPADLPLGDWTLSATWGRVTGAATLAVQQYRKPEYRVEVQPDPAVAVNGDALRFKVAASYFFGAPVVGASVHYTLFESRLQAAPVVSDEGEGDGEGGEDAGAAGGYGRMLESGEARTDVDGRVAIAFTPARVAYDRRLTLEVEVVDASQRSVSARGSAIVGRGLYGVELRPASPLFMAGQPLAVDVITRDHAGRPVQAAVRLEVNQDVWDPLEHRMTRASRPLASVTGTTSALHGTARLTVSPSVARAGNLTLRAWSDDARGNRITAEASVWVYDDRVWVYPYRFPSLEAFADRDTFAPGDTARVLVDTDVNAAAVLVSVEGREVYDAHVQHLFGNTGLVRIPIRAEWAPNVFVALHVRRGAEVRSRVLNLAVRVPRHDLAITLTPDRADYRPGDRARLRVETRDAAGRPVPAELALGVVDEAIYALRADATPDPHDVFYGQRPDWVTTVVSFPTLYFGGADKGDGRDVRKDFRDVALWAPAVSTGTDGRVDVEVRFPDNLTTWRATARGMTDATLVGTTVAKLLVSQDVVARLATPRGLTAGDAVSLVSVTTNRTAAPLTGVTQSLQVAGPATLAGPGSVTASLAPHGEARATWALTAGEPARDTDASAATLTFRARAGSGGDALEQRVPVLPRAVPLVVAGADRTAPDVLHASVALPANLVRGGSHVAVELTASPAALALGAAHWLLDYPYGCTEQTSSAILAAGGLLAAGGDALPESLATALGRGVAAQVRHLLSLRSPEGGWGWWHEDDPGAIYTALAIDALARAAGAGVDHDECLDQVEQARWPLTRMLADVRSADGEAYCAAHLSRVLTLPEAATRFGELRDLVGELARSASEQRGALGTSGLACAALAQSRLGRTADAKALLEAALARAESGPAGLTFPAAGDEGWWNDRDETAGYALAALAAIAPADPRGARLVSALAPRRTGAHWRSTRVTGVAAAALADWLAAHPEALRGAPRVRASWNGTVLLDDTLRAGNGLGGRARVLVPAALLQGGANALVVERSGGGGPVDVAWEGRVLVPSPGPESHETRLAVQREYLRAERVSDRRGRPQWLARPIDAAAPVRVGETILVRLTLTAGAGLERVMVEDPRPAGLEIEDVLPAGAERPYGTWGEARDDRAAFFIGHLDAGETVIEYLLRPELAGTFTALPASAGPMYDPGLFVRGREARLRVVE